MPLYLTLSLSKCSNVWTTSLYHYLLYFFVYFFVFLLYTLYCIVWIMNIFCFLDWTISLLLTIFLSHYDEWLRRSFAFISMFYFLFVIIVNYILSYFQRPYQCMHFSYYVCHCFQSLFTTIHDHVSTFIIFHLIIILWTQENKLFNHGLFFVVISSMCVSHYYKNFLSFFFNKN